MSDYREWLDSFDEFEDEGKAAEEALNDLGRLSSRSRELLWPVLKDAFWVHRRSKTRSVERRISLGSVYSGESSVDQRRVRLERTFALPDGRRVSWAEATEEDHLARIAYLEKHVSGIRQTMGEHQRAVDLIREHGVSCLAEIGEAA